MQREYTILDALKPHLKVYTPVHLCINDEIIGSSFIMERVRGIIIRRHVPQD